MTVRLMLASTAAAVVARLAVGIAVTDALTTALGASVCSGTFPSSKLYIRAWYHMKRCHACPRPWHINDTTRQLDWLIFFYVALIWFSTACHCNALLIPTLQIQNLAWNSACHASKCCYDHCTLLAEVREMLVGLFLALSTICTKAAACPPNAVLTLYHVHEQA